MILFIYAVTGVLAGFLAGLFGIGGGLITVPCLVFSFYLQGYVGPHIMHFAIGTSLGAMVLTAASSALAHVMNKGVYWNLFWGLAPGVVIGSVLGAFIADHTSSRMLELFFGISECIIGLYFFCSRAIPISQNFSGKNDVPNCSSIQKSGHSHEIKGTSFSSSTPFLMTIFGIAIGGFSTVLGIGGGIVTVPLLTAFRTPFRNAISTSAVSGFIIATVGAASFLYLGLENPSYNGSVGFIHIQAFIVIGITSALLAPYGAKCTYTLPVAMLRKAFGIILILTGVLMIYGP